MADDLLAAALADSPIAIYDYRSGAINTDSSGNGHTLTNNNVVSGTQQDLYTGELGSALYDYPNNAYSTQDDAAFDNLIQATTDQITLEALVRMNATRANHQVIVAKGQSGSTRAHWHLMMKQSQSHRPRCVVQRASGYEENVVATGTYTAGTWYFIQVVLPGANTTNAIRWWVDGVSQANQVLSAGAGSFPSDAAHPLYIGRKDVAVTNQDFDGDIAWVAIYDGDIGDTRLQAHWTALNSGTATAGGSSASLLHLLRRRRRV